MINEGSNFCYRNSGQNSCEDRCENKCENRCSTRREGCRATIAEILRNIRRYGCNTPVTIYLNSPSTLSANSSISSISLAVVGNAPVTGTTGSQSVDLSQSQARIAPGAITISTSGTVDVPGLGISPANVLTDAITVPLQVNSTGTANVSLSGGTANITIPSLSVSGSTAAQNVNVPITQVGPIKINTGKVDKVTIPALDVYCKPCPYGKQNEYCGCENKGNQRYKGSYEDQYSNEGYEGNYYGQDSYGQGAFQGHDGYSCHEDSGCIKLSTRPTEVCTHGGCNYVDVNVSKSLRGSACIPSVAVSGQTASRNITAPLSGQSTASVSVSSVNGSNLPIPRTGVSGVTSGASDVPVTATGSNTNSVSLSGSVTVGNLPVTGVAATNGLPVNGTAVVNTTVSETPVSFTGVVEYVDCNIVVLRENGTNRRVTLSLCDVLKIQFNNFRGIRCMERVFGQDGLDRSSCAYGIQKALQSDKCKPGIVELYGRSTNNPINGAISTKNILLVAGGVLWEVSGTHCSCITNTVYSLCNIAGYTFTGLECPPVPPCGNPCQW